MKAGGKDVGFAVAHDPGDQKRRLTADAAIGFLEDGDLKLPIVGQYLSESPEHDGLAEVELRAHPRLGLGLQNPEELPGLGKSGGHSDSPEATSQF